MKRSRHKTLVALLALLVVAAFAGCKKAAPDPFPATGTVTGWEKTGETRTFAAKDLYQYIDGDAEQYVAAGVVTTSTADYKYRGSLEATVDVHTMNDTASAAKIFAKEQSAGNTGVSIGDAAVVHPQSVVFRKGHSLVRIVAYQSAPGAQEALQALARGIDAKL